MQTRWRRLGWTVAATATVVAVLEALALISIAPLKTVVPYTILVDRQTGFVQALDPSRPQVVRGDVALTHSFLAQYVVARESFDIAALQSNYRKVALWSAQAARRSYIADMQSGSPTSPLARYPRTTVIETRVKSVSPLAPGAALVRFDSLRRDMGGEPQRIGSWAAVIRYRYSGEPMRLEDRLVNPLGFQVVQYRRDAEVVPDDQPAALAQAAPTISIAPPPPTVPGSKAPVVMTAGPTVVVPVRR
jgi:type IV secretion system protein VirB8